MVYMLCWLLLAAAAAGCCCLLLLLLRLPCSCNNPIFAEIVPPQLRPMVYALDRCFEGGPPAMRDAGLLYSTTRMCGTAQSVLHCIVLLYCCMEYPGTISSSTCLWW
jgi:hypothetical protein